MSILKEDKLNDIYIINLTSKCMFSSYSEEVYSSTQNIINNEEFK